MASVNRLTKLEHLSVRIENGHLVPLAYAAVDMEDEQAGDGHGSKLIVVPFDGAGRHRDLLAIRPQSAPPSTR